MTYIDYMNLFWKIHQSEEFSSNEVYLYFFLLNECNTRGWQNPFEYPNRRIVLATGMSEKTVIEVRNRLQQKGLLRFEAGKRNAKSPVYYLPEESKKESKKESKQVSKTVSKTVSKEVSKKVSLLNKTKENKREDIDNNIPPIPPEGESEKIDYRKLVDYFNKTFAGKLPAVTQLTDKRKAAIKARMANHGKDAIFQMLLNAANSPFLLGENNQNWHADFDWIFKPTNFVKILEGNYLKREDNGQTTSNATTDQYKPRKGLSSNGTDAENKRREREHLGRLADAILQESATKNSQ